MLGKLAVGEIAVGEVMTGEIVLGKLRWGNDLTPKKHFKLKKISKLLVKTIFFIITTLLDSTVSWFSSHRVSRLLLILTKFKEFEHDLGASRNEVPMYGSHPRTLNFIPGGKVKFNTCSLGKENWTKILTHIF